MNRELLPVTTDEEAARYRAAGFWKDETVAGRFLKAAGIAPQKVAIICGEHTITYAGLREAVDRIAGNLLTLGIRRGDIVSVQMPNSIEQPLVHIALDRIGAIYMPLHLGFQETELRHLLAKAGVVAAIMPRTHRGVDYPALYRAVSPDVPSLRHRFSIGGESIDALAFEGLLEPCQATSAELDALAPHPDDVAHIMLSSGTTALPKISVFTNNNLLSVMDGFAGMIRMGVDDVAAALAPMGTGATGYCYPVLPVILSGGTTVILEHWSDPAEAVDMIVRHRCTFATGIPTQLNLMLPALAARPASDFEAFRCFSNAGAPLPYDVGRKIEEIMSCRIHSIYGSTDGGVPCMTALDDPPDKRLGTVGRVLPGRMVELRNPAGEKVAEGEAGEICWKTPDKSFGYLNDMAAARLAFDEDGFYRSGDLARRDSDGYVSIVGRVKDMILRGGRNISPRLIEDLLVDHPAIREVAVAAMPHPSLGEQACAFVVLKADVQFTLVDAVEFLNSKKIAKWQLPERVEIIDQLPMSAGGKVAKNKLTEYIIQKLCADGAE